MKNIKKTLLLSLFTLISFSVFAQKFNKKQLKKIHCFLVDFEIAVNSEDTLKLKEYIFPYRYEGGMNNQDYAIQKILNEQETLGMDFEYSKKAFTIIRETLYKNFIPMTEEVRKFFNYPLEAKNILNNYKNDQLAILYYKKTLIVLILEKKTIKLFFTEGMNYLITE
jgi:hypothetical protein